MLPRGLLWNKFETSEQESNSFKLDDLNWSQGKIYILKAHPRTSTCKLSDVFVFLDINNRVAAAVQVSVSQFVNIL